MAGIIIPLYPGDPMAGVQLADITDMSAAARVRNTKTDAELSEYELKSADFTAVLGGAYALDTTSDSFNVTLPAAPTEGQEVCFADARGTWHTHPPTFLRNGNKIEGQQINFVDSAQGTFFCALFIDATTGWRILESGTKPQNLTLPTITGNTVGAAITSTNGTWTGTPTSYTYAWQISDTGTSGWANIEAATSASYTPGSGDEDKFVRVQVTATNSNGSSLPASSAASEAIEVSAFPAGAVAHWRLNEESGVRADATGNGYDLTDNNSVGYAAGKIGNAAVGEGALYVTEYLSFVGSDIPIAPSKTMACWVYLNAAAFSGILSWGAPNRESLFLYPYNGQMQVCFDPGFGWQNQQAGAPANTSDVPIGEWAFVAARWDNETGDWCAFVNGTKTTVAVAATVTSTTRNNLVVLSCIGESLETINSFYGNVDSLTIWNRALSDAEIANLYNSGAGLDYPA